MNGGNSNSDARKSINIEEELVPYVVQLRERNDPKAALWTPTNEHAVARGMLFVNEKQPSGHYLLDIPVLNGQFSGRTIIAGM